MVPTWGIYQGSWASGLHRLLQSMGVLPEDGNRLRMKGEQLTQVPSYKSGKGTPTMKPKQVTTEELE